MKESEIFKYHLEYESRDPVMAGRPMTQVFGDDNAAASIARAMLDSGYAGVRLYEEHITVTEMRI